MKNTTIKFFLLASLVVPAFGLAVPNGYFLRDGVNLQPSYYCNGDMNLGWDLMNKYGKVQFVRIEMDPDGYATVLDFTRWIKEANDNGYRVIATYHKGADIGSPDPSKF